MEEHNETLKAVLQRAENFGITFNKEKYVFGVDEIDFYGYRFTKEGLKPSHEKMKAVKEIRVVKILQELAESEPKAHPKHQKERRTNIS